MKIGIMRGRENSFPNALIEKINGMKAGITAEFVMMGGTALSDPCPYAVILDRISHEVPYYQVYLKQASMQGTYVVNNPFWVYQDDKFFGYSLAQKLGIPEPVTVVLPNRENVQDITPESLRNLWPVDWDARLAQVGLPCIMKPAFGGGWKNVHKVNSKEEAISFYNQSGQLTMMLQQFIAWDDYIRCICIGRKYTRPIRYIPRPAAQGEYVQDLSVLDKKQAKQAEEFSVLFNEAIGYDTNAMEFAVKDGVLYAIDITNHACDLDIKSLREAHFPWVVEHMAKFLVDSAKSGARNKPAAAWDKYREKLTVKG